MEILGIDVGGSGIKGAIVETSTGQLLTERHRIPTPKPATPVQVSQVVAEIAQHFDWHGKIGCCFPAVIQQGVARTAANIDRAWIGADVDQLFSESTGCATFVLNDADAAGYAEIEFGAAKGCKGFVVVLTIGTGIGSALFIEHQLVPNTELGHIILPNGKEAEKYTSDAIRTKKELTWIQWGQRFDEYLVYIESLFWPELIVIGGGISKKFHKFIDYITIKTPIIPAGSLNNAGIIGSALAAEKYLA